MHLDDARFWARFARQPNGCLEWTGARSPAGYGNIRIGNRLYLTHRLVYEAWRHLD